MIIKLQRNLETVIDDEDYDLVKDYHWHAQYNPDTKGYYVVTNAKRSDGRPATLSMHRLIMNAAKGTEVDHRNHDTLDNRKNNLRISTSSQNKYNSGKQSNNTTGYKGVSFDKARNKFRAQINKDCKKYHLGRFDMALEASEAYERAARELHGEFYYQTTN